MSLVLGLSVRGFRPPPQSLPPASSSSPHHELFDSPLVFMLNDDALMVLQVSTYVSILSISTCSLDWTVSYAPLTLADVPSS